MKKLCFSCFLIFLCSVLSACDPGSYDIDREALNQVVSVELIEYTNTDQKTFFSWVPNHFDKLLPFNADNMTVLEVLPEEKISDLLDTFVETDILAYYYAYNSPKDICLRLNYENGDFLILWADYANNSYGGYIGEYSSDGTVLSFWGCFSGLFYYTDLVNQFFPDYLA